MKPQPGRKCSVCESEHLVTIQRELMNTVPLSELASRYGLQKSSLHRHAQNHMGRTSTNAPKRTPKPGPRGTGVREDVGTVSRFETVDGGRCRECNGLLSDVTDGKLGAQELVWRAERLLHVAEKIALGAQDSGDARVCLLAVDRAQKALETLMKVSGLLRPEGVHVDARSINIFDGWDKTRLKRFIARLDGTSEGEFEALMDESAVTVPALSAPRDAPNASEPHSTARAALTGS
jgi:hypothetical protein